MKTLIWSPHTSRSFLCSVPPPSGVSHASPCSCPRGDVQAPTTPVWRPYSQFQYPFFHQTTSQRLTRGAPGGGYAWCNTGYFNSDERCARSPSIALLPNGPKAKFRQVNAAWLKRLPLYRIPAVSRGSMQDGMRERENRLSGLVVRAICCRHFGPQTLGNNFTQNSIHNIQVLIFVVKVSKRLIRYH